MLWNPFRAIVDGCILLVGIILALKCSARCRCSGVRMFTVMPCGGSSGSVTTVTPVANPPITWRKASASTISSTPHVGRRSVGNESRTAVRCHSIKGEEVERHECLLKSNSVDTPRHRRPSSSEHNSTQRTSAPKTSLTCRSKRSTGRSHTEQRCSG